MKHNKRPYQARVKLKSIRYWQSVVNGELPAKRPLAYYVNQLKHYSEGDIAYLIGVSQLSAVKQTGQAFNFDNDPPII